jgi:hypothetical protein
MTTKKTRAPMAQKRQVKNQKRAVKAQKRKAQAKQSNAKATSNFFSFFMNHPVAGRQRIDFRTELERFSSIYNHVNQSPEYAYSAMYHSHKQLMELYVSDKPIDEHFFTIAMHYLVAFDSVGAALKSNMFPDYGFMIGPVHDDFEAAMIGILDYDSWDYGRENRNAA